MGRTDLYPIVDKALDGQLDARLRGRRADGASFEQIARELHIDGIPVSGETVRQWCIQNEIPAPERAAS